MEIRNEVYIGVNGVGKTKKLEQIIKDLKKDKKCKEDENIIYIPTEQIFKDEIEKEKVSGKGNFNHKIKNIIRDVFIKSNNFTYELTNEQLAEIKNRDKFKDDISDFFEELKKDDDDFILKSSDIVEDNRKINTISINISGYNTPSGQNSYSLIKLLSKIISKAKEEGNDLNDLKDYYLIIDEPEKFCHPQLVRKVANYLKEISKKINVILTTHSPLFLSYYIDERRTKINYLKKEGSIKEGIFIEDLISYLKKIIKKDNEKYQTMGNENKTWTKIIENKIHRVSFLENLFSSKIILVEDISTKFFVEYILDELNLNFNCFICHGVSNIWKFQKALTKIGYLESDIYYLADLDRKPNRSVGLNHFDQNQIIHHFINNLESDLEDEIKGNMKKSDVTLNKKPNAIGIIYNIDEIKKSKIYKEIKHKISKI